MYGVKTVLSRVAVRSDVDACCLGRKLAPDWIALQRNASNHRDDRDGNRRQNETNMHARIKGVVHRLEDLLTARAVRVRHRQARTTRRRLAAVQHQTGHESLQRRQTEGVKLAADM